MVGGSKDYHLRSSSAEKCRDMDQFLCLQFSFIVVSHTIPNPQHGSVFAALDNFIRPDTAANTFGTIVSIREEPGRAITLVGIGKRQRSYI